MNDKDQNQDNNLRKILDEVAADERVSLANTWRIVGDVGDPNPDQDAVEAAYARVERRMSSNLTVWRRVSAIAALFVLGTASGLLIARLEPNPVAVDDRPLFMVLVRHQDDVTYSEEEQARLVSELSGWARRLGTDGHLVDGNELTESGAEFRLVDGEPRTLDLELTAASSTGYFLIRAGDDNQAEELVKTCPYLDHGGTLELRRVIER